jgi:hypothetical protein
MEICQYLADVITVTEAEERPSSDGAPAAPTLAELIRDDLVSQGCSENNEALSVAFGFPAPDRGLDCRIGFAASRHGELASRQYLEQKALGGSRALSLEAAMAAGQKAVPAGLKAPGSGALSTSLASLRAADAVLSLIPGLQQEERQHGMATGSPWAPLPMDALLAGGSGGTAIGVSGVGGPIFADIIALLSEQKAREAEKTLTAAAVEAKTKAETKLQTIKAETAALEAAAATATAANKAAEQAIAGTEAQTAAALAGAKRHYDGRPVVPGGVGGVIPPQGPPYQPQQQPRAPPFSGFNGQQQFPAGGPPRPFMSGPLGPLGPAAGFGPGGGPLGGAIYNGNSNFSSNNNSNNAGLHEAARRLPGLGAALGLNNNGGYNNNNNGYGGPRPMGGPQRPFSSSSSSSDDDGSNGNGGKPAMPGLKSGAAEMRAQEAREWQKNGGGGNNGNNGGSGGPIVPRRPGGGLQKPNSNGFKPPARIGEKDNNNNGGMMKRPNNNGGGGGGGAGGSSSSSGGGNNGGGGHPSGSKILTELEERGQEIPQYLKNCDPNMIVQIENEILVVNGKGDEKPVDFDDIAGLEGVIGGCSFPYPRAPYLHGP